MWRKTVESLPSPLDRRIVLCVTSQAGYTEDFLNEGYDLSFLLNTDKIFIGGGAKLYRSTFDIVDELWITEVANGVDNCDTWYKIPKDDFTMFEHTNPLGETLTYRFTKWGRKQVFSS